MADVGSVSVGVVVHGDGLGEQLSRTIRTAVLPVIKQLNRELDASKKKANAIDGSGYLKLAAAAREAAISVRDVGDAHRSTARYARTATLEQIAYYDQVADAAERSAQRQIEAAIAVATARATIPQEPPGGGGGGGGGVRSGNNGGRRQGGFLGAALSPVGMNVLAFATTGIDPALLGIAQLTQGLVDLSGAGAAIPAVFAGIASSAGVAVAGFQGVGTAVKEMWKSLATGDAKDIEKAAQSLKNLAPNAQSAVKALGELGPVLTGLRKDIQNDIFAGLDVSLKSFVSKSVPTFTKGTRDIANAWNATFKELLNVAGSDQTQGFLGKIFGNTADAQRRLNSAIQPLVGAFGRLSAEGSDFLPRLAEGINPVR